MYTLTRTHAGSAIVALAAILSLAFATPASAWWFGGNSGDDNDIKVSVSNNATVTNTVKVEAETGDNDANGGDGAKGGNGGDAKGSGVNTAGTGGNGGSGALGGLIMTGNAAAYASILNEVNVNKTYVSDSCGCESSNGFFGFGGGDDNDISVKLRNQATVMNTVKVEAETGDNDANGGDGAKGGNGGDATAKRDSRGSNHYFAFWSFGKSQDKNTAGHGGTGGTGGVGGEIYTGNAVSGADVVNVVNRNVTRVTR